MWIKTHRYLVCIKKDPKLSMHHLLIYINQYISGRKSKDKDSTVNKTEYRSKRSPTGKTQKSPQKLVVLFKSGQLILIHKHALERTGVCVHLPDCFPEKFGFKSKKEGKDQELIQSSTTPDPGYQWESNKLTIRHYKREQRGHPFPAGVHSHQ